MSDAIDEMIDALLVREGGYVNHKADKGGPTNMGITQATLSNYRGKPVSIDDVRNLDEAEARAIYRQNYWIAPGFDALGLPPLAQEMLFDAGVNHGPKNAVKQLQSAVGVPADGIIGPMTRNAIAGADAERLPARMIAERVEFFGRIITRSPSQAVFAHGWMRRCKEFIERLRG